MRKTIGTAFVGLLLSASVSFAAPAAVPADAEIYMERTMCYGTCPAYSLTIHANGDVEFYGKSDVSAPGAHAKKIPQADVAAILAEAASIGFFDLKGQYDCHDVTDNPSALLSITQNGKTKHIFHYFGCRSADKKELDGLSGLEEKIDRLAAIKDWVRQ